MAWWPVFLSSEEEARTATIARAVEQDLEQRTFAPYHTLSTHKTTLFDRLTAH